MNYHHVPLMIVLAMLIGASEPAAAQGRFTIDDLERIRQPLISALASDGTWVSYVLGDTLWIVAARGGGSVRAVSAGMSNQVNYRQPFQAWSPDDMRLLYRTGTAGARGQGMPMVHDLASGEVAPLLTEQYAACLQTFLHWAASGPTWSPDGSKIALLAADTTGPGTHLGLYLVDVATGAITLAATDTTGPFGGVASAAWSPDGRWLAFGTGGFAGNAGRLVLRHAAGGRDIVLRDGGAPMYRMLNWSPDGRLLSVLPHNGRRFLLEIDSLGRARVISETVPFAANAWAADGRLIGVQSQGMSAVPAVWRPGDDTPTALAAGDTLFQIVGVGLSGRTSVIAFTKESGGLPLDVWTAELAPGAAELRAPTRITHANGWLDSISIARAGVIRWRGPAGDTLDALLFLPAEHAARPPYPLVVRPYGAYSNEFPKSEYFMDAGTQLLTALGWAVVQPNTRGMASHALTGRYGEVQLADTRALIDTLVSREVVNPRRVAVIGHSHGGAMTYYYLTHDAGLCGVVAVNGWSDWSQISDRLRARDDELPGMLGRSSPILNPEAVNVPLLAVSGAQDTQVPPENAARMVDALRALGKSAELLHFADEGHLITQPENRRLFWIRVLDFLAANCTP